MWYDFGKIKEGGESMGMYFYNTLEPGELDENDPGCAVCICEKCGEVNSVDFDECEIVTDEYIKLKEDKELICEKCGEKAEQIIPYRPLDQPKSPPTNKYVPKCPICHSPNIHKITTGTKVARAAIWGIFALPKAGKQWKCDNCGSEF